MNCHEAYLWMLEAEEPTVSPPASVAEHLRDCSKCRRRQKRVLRLLTAVQRLPPPPDNPHARAEVLSIVRQAANVSATRSGTRHSWLWHVLAIAAAVLVAGVVGWLLTHFSKL